MGKFDGMMLLTDMDGTFLNSNREISDENARAAEYFMREGGKFSVATGRVKRAMEYFMPKLKMNAPAVLFNGSVIYDFENGRPVAERPLESKQALEFAQDMIRTFPQMGVEVFLAEDEFVANNSPITQRHFQFVKLPLKECPIEKIPTPCVKFNLTAEHEVLLKVEEYCRKKYGDCYTMQFSSPYFYEIMMGGADKGTGARLSCDFCGISHDRLYTVGDGLNDRELIACAALSFAPENAVETIKESADVILPDCDHHTIAAAVDHLERMSR